MTKLERLECKAAFTADETGVIEGIAWPFNTVDLVGDVIEPEAVADAIGKTFPMLYGHAANQTVGTWSVVTADAEGLKVKGRLQLADIPLAKTVKTSMLKGESLGLSIGFYTRKFAPRDGGGRTISQLDLTEISICEVPCNPGARVLVHKESPMTAAAEFETKFADLETKLADNDNKLMDRLDKIEARVARTVIEPVETKSAGVQLVESDEFKAFAASRSKGRASIEMKAITSATATVGAGTDGSTSLVPSHHIPGIIAPAVRPLTVRSLLAQGSTESGVLQYVRETGFTNNAAPVAEGAAKPYSDLTFNQITTPVRVIAHLFKASKQVLEDSAQLAGYIDTRARDGLADVEENQLLNGSGTGQNLDGLVPNATAFNTALVKAGDNKADLIRRAILQVRLAEYRATGIVLHPTDWADIELLKETTGGYIWSNPTINNGQNLWGIPVVDTTAMAEGEFLVGAFQRAAQVWDRWQARVEVSTENDKDFENNLVTIRAEERLALAIYRPESFVHGEFEVAEEG